MTASAGLSATDNQAGGQHQTVSDAVLRAFQAMATAKAPRRQPNLPSLTSRARPEHRGQGAAGTVSSEAINSRT